MHALGFVVGIGGLNRTFQANRLGRNEDFGGSLIGQGLLKQIVAYSTRQKYQFRRQVSRDAPEPEIKRIGAGSPRIAVCRGS